MLTGALFLGERVKVCHTVYGGGQKEEAMNIVVLGAGRVGGAIVDDLSLEEGFNVTAVDASERSLDRLNGNGRIEKVQSNLGSAGEVERVVKNADLVVGAVPGYMGFATLKAVIEAGKSVVDISFFEEDPFTLDELAKGKNVTAIVDCGIAPGAVNIIAGYLTTVMDRVDAFDYVVGGLPVVRNWPYEYKAVFSPTDVIEEYIRPARFVVGGEERSAPALSDPELMDFQDVGTLEAFNTDGLRTLLRTMKIPNMKEKTLRYPGHIEKMKLLRETGFFSKEPVEVNGVVLRPIDLTAKLLFPMWRLYDGDEDLTVMRISATGATNSGPVRYTYELLDGYDAESGTTSMARTTGYTCTGVVRLVAQGLFSRKGISPPEFIGSEPGCYLFVMQELAKRGVVFKETVV